MYQTTQWKKFQDLEARLKKLEEILDRYEQMNQVSQESIIQQNVNERIKQMFDTLSSTGGSFQAEILENGIVDDVGITRDTSDLTQSFPMGEYIIW